MAGTKPAEIGKLNKGNYVVIDGAPCKVVGIDISRPGKHGHAKVRLTGKGLLDDKKRVVVAPGHDHIDVPIVDKRNAQVLSVEGESANVMDSENYQTFDLKIPEELRGQVASGNTVLYWEVMTTKVMKQVKD